MFSASLGVSELSFDEPLADLKQHFQNLRYIDTGDGQRYFFRYADMRAIGALLVALDISAQRRSLFGLLSNWRFFGRDGELKDWVQSDQRHSPSTATGQRSQLRLDDKQLSRLMDAMLADRLSNALEELCENGLNPNADGSQHTHVRAAAVWLQRESVESFAVQRAVARHSVETQGACLERPHFSLAVRRAHQSPRREYEVLGECAANSHGA